MDGNTDKFYQVQRQPQSCHKGSVSPLCSYYPSAPSAMFTVSISASNENSCGFSGQMLCFPVLSTVLHCECRGLLSMSQYDWCSGFRLAHSVIDYTVLAVVKNKTCKTASLVMALLMVFIFQIFFKACVIEANLYEIHLSCFLFFQLCLLVC